jgi:hypothetical protein
VKRYLVLLAALSSLIVFHCAAQSTSFTYQGRLNLNGVPANGTYDLTFGLFASPFGGGPVPSPFTNYATGISDGMFTVTINSLIDGVFNGSSYWLEIGVRTNGVADFTTLSPRQTITPTPYAIFAQGARATGLIGTLPATSFSGTYGAAIAMNNTNNSFGGAFHGSVNGNGGGLTNVHAATLDGFVSSNLWQLGGNAVAPGYFLGSTNNQPVEFKVNGRRALRLEHAFDAQNSSTNNVNVVGGSSSNYVASHVGGATVFGGGVDEFGTSFYNSVTGDFGTVSGGVGNSSSAYAFVGGGYDNSSTGGGGAVIVGGAGNRSTDFNSFVGAGDNNVCSGSSAAVVGGGRNAASQNGAFVGAGFGNIASGGAAFVGGGGGHVFEGEYFGNTASGTASVIVGGLDNSSSGLVATVPGGASNSAAGDYSFAAGRRAKANHHGTLVWADSQDADFASTATNQFLIRALGGVGIGVNAPQQMLSVSQGMNIDQYDSNSGAVANTLRFGYGSGEAIGSKRNPGGNRWGLDFYTDSVNRMTILNNGNVGLGTITPTDRLMVVNAHCDGNSWINASDRNLKQDFTAVNPQAVLEKVAALPVQTWSYKAEPGTKHLGPMAQDFKAAFGLGRGDTGIATVDESGVALAAIQGLNQKVEEQRAENAELKRELADLKKLVQQLAHSAP